MNAEQCNSAEVNRLIAESWVVASEFDDDCEVEIRTQGSDVFVCELAPFDGAWGPEEIAVVRLIAAAPRLLSALRWSVNQSGECLGDHPALLHEAKTLLAGIEGAA